MIFTSILILIVAKALPSINRNLSSIYFTRISTILFLYAGVLNLNTFYIQSIGSGIAIYSGLFQITQVSVLIESFLFFISSLILIAWPNISFATNNSSSSQITTSYQQDYSLIVLFSSLGSCLLISSFDLISLYISIELQSFGLYVLSTLYRDSESSTKAGLKYFLLGGLSSSIILLGCGIIYSYTGLTNFESIYSIISTSNSIIYSAQPLLANNTMSLSYGMAIHGLSLGLILIFVGFLFKIAAAPLHNWSPDVYDEVPTIVTIWLTIIPKISILILLLELQYYGFSMLTSETIIEIPANVSNIFNLITNPGEAKIAPLLLKNLLLISSLLSLIIGTVVGLAQSRLKRLLAYSTISHIGFILLALAINSESSIDSLIFYIVQYTITNLNVFLIIIALSYIFASSLYSIEGKNSEIRDIRYIAELKGKFFTNPLLSLSLAICLFSMAGIPPLIGFFSKQFVLYSAIQNGYYFISIIAILVSVISASYYLKIVVQLFLNTNHSLETSISSENNNVVSSLLNSKTGNSLKRETSSSINNNNFITNKYLSNVHSYLISVLTLSILLFILKPSLILNSTQLLSLSLFNW
uniref:NADH dehydrogenase subunit 2 n=1 Tax=Agaricus bitorquis TaxID=5343 RepID=UPI0027A076B9|nr:NADH dehydrogenase subunit 2 [Agaricus bitorquis]WFG53992.1 NADH dehydrogenase subunit 2 [Agaricus bitorquis]